MNNLDVDQQTTLKQATQHALDDYAGTTIVQPGEYYNVLVNGKPFLLQATQPIRARFHIVLDTDVKHLCSGLSAGGACDSPTGSCFFFCDEQFFPGYGLPPTTVPSLPDWYAYVVTRVVWDYSTLDGNLALDQPDASSHLVRNAADPSGYSYMTLMRFQWKGKSWQVSLFIPSFPQIAAPDFTTSQTAGTGFSIILLAQRPGMS